MLEILQYATSGFFVFLGCFMISTGVIISVGWAANAVLIGMRGKRCADIKFFGD